MFVSHHERSTEMLHHLMGILAILCLALPASAVRSKVYKADDSSRAQLTSSRDLSFFYNKPSWNQNVTQVEKGYVYLKDRANNEVYELLLTETEPNSSVFSVEIQPGFLKRKTIEAEIYSVPPTILQGKNRVEVVKGLLAKNNLKRKPFLLRVLRRKGQIVDIFDDKTEAIASYERYKKLLGLDASVDVAPSDSIIEVSKKQQPVKRKVIDTSTLQSMFLANEVDQQNVNLKNSELRDILRKVETKRRRMVKNNGKSWSRGELTKNEALAKDEAKKADGHTRNKTLKLALESYLKASDLAPQNETYYQFYGLSLYQNKKYNHSIVVLELVNAPKKLVPENDYYLGMNYYQLKDWPNAEKYFAKAMGANDKRYSASAAFYLGLTQNEQGKYDESQKSFQYVLDHSDDPLLDKRAEQYIEHSIRQKVMAEKRSHRWFFDGVLGVIYDSNVILALDAQANDATDKEGFRFLATNRTKYRALYRDNHELGIQTDITLMQTQKTDFGSSSTLEAADPWVFGLGVPWTFRGTLFQKGYSFVLEPKYETIYMDLDDTGKKSIINSVVLDMDNTLVISKKWVAKANYQIRQDNVDIAGSDEASATKFVSDFSSIIVLDQDAQRYLIPLVGYTVNNAKGADFAYTRVDFGFTITNSLFQKFVWSNQIGYYLSNYQSERTDKNYALTSSLAYALNPHWNAALSANFQRNDSNTNPYDKVQVMSTFSYSF